MVKNLSHNFIGDPSFSEILEIVCLGGNPVLTKGRGTRRIVVWILPSAIRAKSAAVFWLGGNPGWNQSPPAQFQVGV